MCCIYLKYLLDYITILTKTTKQSYCVVAIALKKTFLKG